MGQDLSHVLLRIRLKIIQSLLQNTSVRVDLCGFRWLSFQQETVGFGVCFCCNLKLKVYQVAGMKGQFCSRRHFF